MLGISTPLPADWTREMFRCTRADVRRSRTWIRGQARRYNLDAEVVDALVLVASELVANVVLHVPRDNDDAWGFILDLRSSGDGAVKLRVLDWNKKLPVMRASGDRSESGRGLHIVAELSQRWGIRPRSDGKEVWAELGCPATRETDGAPSPDAPTPVSEQRQYA